MIYDFTLFKTKRGEGEAWLERQLGTLHTGRASLGILDGVMIESYGSHMAIPHVAGVSVEDARTIRIAPWDKGHIKEIEKALNNANLGVSVSVDDLGLRVFFPELTTERRHLFVKLVKERLEESRIALRAEREKIWSDIQEQEREGVMTEDEKFRAREDLQKLVDEGNATLEAIKDRKEKEVLGN